MHKKRHQFTLPKGWPYAAGGVSFGPFVQPYNNLIYSGLGGDIGSASGHNYDEPESQEGSTLERGDENGSVGEGSDAGGAGSSGAGAAAM